MLRFVACVVALTFLTVAEGSANNPDIDLNFDCEECEQTTGVHKGTTWIRIFCYNEPICGQAKHCKQPAGIEQCSSPNINTTCWPLATKGGCSCTNDVNAYHPVKVQITNCFPGKPHRHR